MKLSASLLSFLFVAVSACGDVDQGDTQSANGGSTGTMVAKDIASAPRFPIDRFSATAGHLQVRSAENGLPGPNMPVDFDQGPFVTQGFGPAGQVVRYYNFDVQPTTPAPIYALFRAGESRPVEGQLNIVDVVPGDAGYNDFWQVMKVSVPATYVANSITSVEEIRKAGYKIEPTDMLVNCPIVPRGSTAKFRLNGSNQNLILGWYKNQIIYYFTFDERSLSGATVPTSPIFVTFNTNPDKPNGGPASGFRMEANSPQTHNVVATLPSDAGYSPLWSVSVFDNADFPTVKDLASVGSAKILATGVANVNCPIFEVKAR
ncbi:MAG TPA: hypothetical protein VGF45_22955 [Polyangia bacterium]